jgi:hypothetical protein
MKKVIRLAGLVLACQAGGLYCLGAEDGLIAWWKFDEGNGRVAVDAVSGREDSIEGNFWYRRGLSATALKSDGFTTRVVRKTAEALRLDQAFTVEAWIAPQAYPWNWCAIVNQQENHKAGYFFGIDQIGHIGLHLAVNAQWHECTSTQTVPFMEKWSHIVGTFDKNKGIAVYIDGRVEAEVAVEGSLTFAEDMSLQIARNHKKTLLNPTALVRKSVNFPTSYSFDGLIDEVKIYNRALSAEQIRRAYEQAMPQAKPDLKWRRLPELGTGGRFGAVYCRLKFCQEWDSLWRVADHPDVVVSFDDGDYKMAFWRGTNYNMNLVTENNIWVGDQSAEGGGPAGCAEHMSDKQCRFAHVRIIENHDARVVVHWRYAIVDVLYNNGGVDEQTGWGIWADEYYYIYPDGIAVRNFFVHGMSGFSVTEPTVLNNPGQKAEDNIGLDAVTVANMQGQSRTYNWATWPANERGRFKDPVPNANVCIVNLKSRFKPCYVYEPRSRITPYGWKPELRPEYSRFPTWNHWPVSQAPSDGRYALAPDRVSSSAITSPRVPEPRTHPGSITRTGRFIMGLSDRPIERLTHIASSWLQSPVLKITSQAYNSEGYSRDQRAYILSNSAPETTELLEFELLATSDSPLVNPAFVVKDWGEKGAGLKVNGDATEPGKTFRFGHRRRLGGTDLIVWLKTESTEPMKLSLVPVEPR